MTSGEFCNLLSGLMENTPLGNIISIRSEEDPEKLKSFTQQQKKIRDEWRNKLLDKQHKENKKITKEEAIKANQEVMRMMAQAFSKK